MRFTTGNQLKQMQTDSDQQIQPFLLTMQSKHVILIIILQPLSVYLNLNLTKPLNAKFYNANFLIITSADSRQTYLSNE